MAQDELTKSQVIQAILKHLMDMPDNTLDPGQVVLYLERDASPWCTGQTIDWQPLWVFCQERGAWTQEQCLLLATRVQEECSSLPVTWLLPENLIESAEIDSAVVMEEIVESPLAPGLQDTSEIGTNFVDQRAAILAWMVEAVQHSSLQHIVDPSKLASFLDEALDEMWDNNTLTLPMLWSLFAEIDGVTQKMLLETFLYMEAKRPDQLTVPMVWPDMVTQLSGPLRQSMQSSLGLTPSETSRSGSFASASQDGLSSARSGISRFTSQGRSASQGALTASSSSASLFAQGSHQPPRYEKKAESGTAGKSKTRSGKETSDVSGKKNVPLWLAILIFVGMGVGLYWYFHEPVYQGEALNIKLYDHILPLQDLRLFGRSLRVKPHASFFKDPFPQQLEKAKDLFRQVKQSHDIGALDMMSPEGKFLGTYTPPPTQR